ncbi:hypothetical protein [Spiroplasma endosymbiont of Andrena trimmerana]|uniref:hypothetical protein n=1 Tax=Spiroplasma endosymbiont of Andrena trimmerana TaxID=3066316 RepID=UPI0030CE2B2B
MANKNKSEIFQKITAQKEMKDILNQSNSTFKNKKGRKKERHGGLTFKFNKINNTNNQLTDVIINDNPSKSHIENPETVSIILTESENMQETANELEEISSLYAKSVKESLDKSKKIKELTKENQQLKNKIESLEQEKQKNINFDNFKYNAVTILDEYKDILDLKNQLQDQKKELQELKQQKKYKKRNFRKKKNNWRKRKIKK